jgi:hypothetical protein
MRSHWCPCKKREGRERERIPCDNRDRDWSDVPRNQRKLRTSNNCQKLQERHRTDLSESPEGNSHLNTLILDFQLPELWNDKFMLF